MRNFFSNVNEMVEKMAEIDVKKSIFLKKIRQQPEGCCRILHYVNVYSFLTLFYFLFFCFFFSEFEKVKSKAK